MDHHLQTIFTICWYFHTELGYEEKVNFVQMFNSILRLDLMEDKITGDFFLKTDGKPKKSHIYQYATSALFIWYWLFFTD